MLELALDSVENKFVSERLDEAKNSEGKWQELRRIHVSGNRTPSSFTFFSADVLNKHFAATVNPFAPLAEENFQYTCDYMTNLANSFEFRLASTHKVRCAILNASSKSSEPDKITAAMLKAAPPVIIQPLTDLCNASLINATFPIAWKKALILPSAKNKTMLSSIDTPPIAQLSELSKVLERIAHGQLLSYLETHRLPDYHQVAFRRGHSTQTTLLGVLDDV